jgi:ribosomal protein S18 acetylase RimI-like enzyme
MISNLRKEHIVPVAMIHKKELTGFLPELGSKFLEKFYQTSLNLPEMFTFVELKEKKVLGFVSGIESTKGMYKKIILKDLPGFGLLFMRYFITHPRGLVKMIKTIAYPGFSEDEPELLTLAVLGEFQKKGIGKKLLVNCDKEFLKRGIKKFKISAYARLPANGFYKKRGCKLVSTFNFLGEKMNYYSYER